MNDPYILLYTENIPITSVWENKSINITEIINNNNIVFGNEAHIRVKITDNTSGHLPDTYYYNGLDIKDIYYDHNDLDMSMDFGGSDLEKVLDKENGISCIPQTYNMTVDSYDSWHIDNILGPFSQLNNGWLTVSPMSGVSGITNISITTHQGNYVEGLYGIEFIHTSGAKDYLIIEKINVATFSSTVSKQISAEGSLISDHFSLCSSDFSWVRDDFNLPSNVAIEGLTSGLQGYFEFILNVPPTNCLFMRRIEYLIHSLTGNYQDRIFSHLQFGNGILPTYDKSSIEHDNTMMGIDTITISNVQADVIWRPIEDCDWFHIASVSSTNGTIVDNLGNTYYKGNGTITIAYDSNNSDTSPRTENLTIINMGLIIEISQEYQNHTSEINIFSGDPLHDKIIPITQASAPAPSIAINPDSLYPRFDESPQHFYITTDKDWTTEIGGTFPQNVIISPSSGNPGTEIEITITFNSIPYNDCYEWWINIMTIEETPSVAICYIYQGNCY